jgi:hypothetical protein
MEQRGPYLIHLGILQDGAKQRANDFQMRPSGNPNAHILETV